MYLLGAPRSWLVTGFIFIVSFLPHTGAIRITSKPENITKVLQGTLNYNVSWYWDITPPATISIRVADILVKGVKIGILADGSPPTSVVLANFKSRYNLNTATFNPITLTIKDVQPQDAGEYAMTLVDDGGETTFEASKFTLDVLVPPGVTPGANVTVNKTDKAELSCSATGNPTPNVTWTRSGGADVLGTGETLTISDVKISDGGCYVCTAYNNIGSEASGTVCLTVQYAPNATISVNTTLVCQGDNVALTCTAGDSFPPVIGYHFYRGGTLIVTSSNNEYTAAASIGLPEFNEFTCAAYNLAGGGHNASVTVQAKVPPAITGFSPPQNAAEGSEVMLECNATGSSPNITIERNGEAQLSATGKHTFAAISRREEGSYRCIVHNGGECPTVYSTTNITVNYKPENTTLTPSTASSCQHDMVTLTCDAAAKPVARYHIYVNGELNTTTTNNTHTVRLENTGSVQFTCVPENDVGTGKNATVTINVKAAPSITFITANMTVTEGSLLNLQCNTSGSLPLNVSWSKVGAAGVLASSGSQEFSSITRAQDGTYECMVHNGDECRAASQRVTITVNYKPENCSLTTNTSSNTYLKGDDVMLSCHAHSKPSTCNATLLHDGTSVTSLTDQTCSGLVTSHVVHNIQGCNAERYSCRMSNVAGQCEESITLTINDPASVHVTSTTPSGDTFASNITIIEGESLTLNCTATGCPTPNITWTKQGVSAALRSNITTEIIHQIASVQKSDAGRYTCAANNEIGAVSRTLSVTVHYKPINTQLATTKTRACVNDSITLNCTSEAQPAVHEYLFYRNGVHHQTSASGVLHLNPPLAGDHVYTCVPNNTVGTGVNKTVQIAVKAAPSITFITANMTVTEGSLVNLQCNTSGSLPLNVSWSKVGAAGALSSSGSHELSSITRAQEGTYECMVRNGDECAAASQRVTITVNYKPHETKLSVSTARTCANETVTLNCTGLASPPVHVYHLYRNDDVVDESATGMFVISPTLAGDNAYTCVPNNTLGTGQNSSVHITTTAPPRIHGITSNLTVTEGSNVALQCNATGSEPLNVTWRSPNGAFLSSGVTLNLNILSRNDEGSYQCSASNGNECPVAEESVFVTVIYKPENTSITASKRMACVNDSVTLACASTAKPAADRYIYYRGDSLIHNGTSKTHTITLSAHGTHEYACVASNTAGTGDNSSVVITVQDPPTITHPPSDVTVARGSAASLSCNASGTPPLNISWSRPGSAFYYEGAVLTIDSAATQDDGVYRCVVHNGAHCASRSASATLNVNYKPSITSLSNTTVIAGHILRLYCNTSGKPQANITWSGPSGAGNLPSGNPLVLTSVIKEHAGKYLCNASNSMGWAVESAHVDVQYPPTIVTTPKNTTAYLGGNVTLYCNASSHPAPQIYWAKNGIHIAMGEVLRVAVSSSTAGTYTCTASNGDGANATASASVTVESSCQSNSCKNGGTCVSRGRTFECTCTSEYTGSTCETELSTPMPTSPPNIVYEAEVSVRCKDELYVAELKNKDSPQFKDLEKRFLEQCYIIWSTEENFLRCSVKSFNDGSVIVNFIVSFNETKSEEPVLQRMQTTVSSGYYGTFKVDPDSVKVTSVTTLCSSSPCKYEDSTCVVHGNGYKCECSTFRYGTHCEKGVGVLPGIVIIAACGAVIFVLLVLLIWCCCCSRRSSYPKDLEQDGTNLNTFSTNDHPNSRVNRGADHVVRNGAANPSGTFKPDGTEDDSELMYADIDFSNAKNKDNNKIPSTDDKTLYADITSFDKKGNTLKNGDAPTNGQSTNRQTSSTNCQTSSANGKTPSANGKTPSSIGQPTLVNDVEQSVSENVQGDHEQAHTNPVADDTDEAATTGLYPKIAYPTKTTKVDLYNIV